MELGWTLVVPAYLLGTFPTAILVGRRRGRDVTAEGSGNPGASNALRTMGRRAGAAVLLGDLGKGAVAAGVGLLAGRGVGVACGLAAALGHVAPVTRRFRGGKGVATAAGMAAVLVPTVAAGLAVLWAVTAKATGTASKASITIAVGLPVASAVAGRPVPEVAAFAACGALVVVRHRDNLGRIRRGEEPSLPAGRRRPPADR
ncbi:MAG: glycerol-3-phosphate acyltransferase [Acidimicrobiia bacterium]